MFSSLIALLFTLCCSFSYASPLCSEVFDPSHASDLALSLDQSYEIYDQYETQLASLNAEISKGYGSKAAVNQHLDGLLKKLTELESELSLVSNLLLVDQPLTRNFVDGFQSKLSDIESASRLSEKEILAKLNAEVVARPNLESIKDDLSSISHKEVYRLEAQQATYDIRFSESIVRDLFHNPKRARTAAMTIKAILNGFNQNSSAHLEIFNHAPWIIKVWMYSKDIGTFRMFGIKKDSEIVFDYFIEKSNHGKEWTNRTLVPRMRQSYDLYFGPKE